jgi:hypothetical protein
MQRVRVGLTGLAAVLLIVAAAAAIFESASDEPPVAAIDADHNAAVANMIVDNSLDITPKVPNEPLAEIGVAPGSGPTDSEKAAAVEAASGNSAPAAANQF